MKYPNSLIKLIDGFSRFPGIGKKTAQRLAFFTIDSLENKDIEEFSQALIDSKIKIKKCPICGIITENDLCDICTDETRDKKTIMIVEHVKDAIAIDDMNEYHGLYHILGGVIDYSNGVTPNDLNIESLLKRLDGIEELIIASSATIEGELTAQYIKKILGNSINITRLAYGLPVGTSFEYLDEMTLSKAISGRNKF